MVIWLEIQKELDEGPIRDGSLFEISIAGVKSALDPEPGWSENIAFF